MVSRIKLALGLLVASALLVLGIMWHFDVVSDLKHELATAQDQIESTNRALATKQKALKQVQNAYAKQSKELSDALQDNQEWATGPVPDAVFDSLFNRR